MNHQMKTIWADIEAWRAASDANECRFPMNPPATSDRVEQYLQRALGIRLPEQLRQSLLIHNGMDHIKGSWLPNSGALIPASAGCILQQWKLDRQRAAEAEAENCEWPNSKRYIPIIVDSIAHQTIYIDAGDGRILNYNHAAIDFETNRYPTYRDFLVELLDRMKSENFFEWPRQIIR